MLSPHKIEKIRKYSNKKFWKRLQELTQATQNTKEEEAELVMLNKNVFSRRLEQKGIESYNSAESVARRNDIEELDELTDKIDPKFDELDKVKLKTNAVGMVGIIPAGSEGFVMDILSPDFARYRKTKVVMYRYEVKIEIWDLETFKIILHDRVTVDENEIEGIDTFTIDEEFINRGGKLPPN
jgi:hypothetical protein